MSLRSRLVVGGVGALAMTGAAIAQPDVTFSDGVFSDADWSAVKALDTTDGQAATFAAMQVPIGGNPDEYRFVRHDYCQGQLIVAHLRAGAVYDPAADGAIETISGTFDLIQFNPPPAQAVAYGVLLRQGDSYYTTINSRLIFADVWTSFAQPDLRATDFQRVAGGGPLFPDFSAGALPLEIGYFSGNTSAGDCLRRESGIDNWSVTIDPVCVADMNRDGQLNLFDFLAFQTAFGNGDPAADLALPFGILNLFDFLAFQSAFGDEDPSADLDGNGVLNLFDFLAFQTLFGEGC